LRLIGCRKEEGEKVSEVKEGSREGRRVEREEEKGNERRTRVEENDIVLDVQVVSPVGDLANQNVCKLLRKRR